MTVPTGTAIAAGGLVEATADDLPRRADLERMYEVMQTITTCDDRARAEVKAGKLQAAFYPVRGLEGVCGALAVTVRPTDYLVSTYRNLGDAVSKGVPLGRVVAEACGRVGGVSKGKGGPMHIQDLEAGLVATTGIVGSGLPIAVGLGLAAQLDGGGRASVVTFGDGATAIGAYHEAMNLASLWKLPVVFVCQNNQWAEHTPISEYAPSTDLAGRATSYAMPAIAVDGFDPIATWRVLRDALDGARQGSGPVFLECKTYRLVGHTGSADYSYMPADELQVALARDPAPSFRRWLLEAGLVNEARLQELEARARSTVDDAFEFALASPPPGPDEIYRDVFADERVVPGR